MARVRTWSEDELLTWMAEYIRRHMLLPTAAEYQNTRDDGPDESTIRARLGGWTQGWRGALRMVLEQSTRPTNAPSLVRPQVLALLLEGLAPGEIATRLNLTRKQVVHQINELRRQQKNPDLGKSTHYSHHQGVPTLWTRVKPLLTHPIDLGTLLAHLYGNNPTRHENANLRTQLNNWQKMGRINRVERGVYVINPGETNGLELPHQTAAEQATGRL